MTAKEPAECPGNELYPLFDCVRKEYWFTCTRCFTN